MATKTMRPQKAAAHGPIAVRPYREEDAEAWDRYVRAHGKATFFHQTGWKRVLDATFGYESVYLLAERDGVLHGVLPAFLCRSIRGTLALYSLPHTVYGGPVADDPETTRALFDAARSVARRRGASAIELRNRHSSGLLLAPLDGFVTFEKELPGTVAEVYRTFPKKAREAINQATRRHRLEADFGGDLDSFYDLLAHSYQSLGTPVFPRRFFEAMVREFPRDASILLVRHEGVAVAGVLSMTFRDLMMPLYSGEAPGASALRTSNFKYFRLMEHAVERGLKRFDFGRTRRLNSGVVQFKTNQGFPMETLPYEIHPASARRGGTPDPNRGLFARARPLWRRLPWRLARAIGPRIVKYFP